MGINEIFILVTIVISFIAILVANGRKIVELKFTPCLIIIGILVFIFINYLVFFDYFMKQGFYCHCFIYEKGIPANIWAYIISVISLFVFFLYVSKCSYFPRKKRNKLIVYYKSLINTNNVELLVSFLEKYHRKSIDKKIKQINNLCEQENKKYSDYWCWDEVKDSKEHKLNNKSLSVRLLNEIIADKNFIAQSVKIDSFYFLDIVKTISSNNFFCEPIKDYIVQLVRLKDENFINELKYVNTHNDRNVSEVFKETEYLNCIFSEKNLMVQKFNIDRIIGEEAIREINTDSFWLRKANEWGDDYYYNTISYQFINFFYAECRYLVEYEDNIGESKSKEERWHPYLAYFEYVSKEMLSNYSLYGKDTYAYKFLEDLLNTLNILVLSCNKQVFVIYKHTIENQIKMIYA
ncbi:MAG: hypothetical protein J6W06_08930 [Bacteroidales bacterium]|nr:hypothetical protein [Bacteroidales bacterium]